MRQVTTTRTGANHGLHLALTILTCGLWLAVWPIVGVIGRRSKSVTVTEPVGFRPLPSTTLAPPPAGWYETPDGYGRKYWTGTEWVK